MIVNILKTMAQTEGGVVIQASGTSMFPIIKSGDMLRVKYFQNYDVGDILVFTYKGGSLLVHRLLKIDNTIFFCKGDSSFRMEDINMERIIGKVVEINGRRTTPPPESIMALSLMVNTVFRKLKYDVASTKNSYIYRQYIKHLQTYYLRGQYEEENL